MILRDLRVLILGSDPARRRLLRAALGASEEDGSAGSARVVHVSEAAHPRELVPRPRAAFDVALLAIAPEEDPLRLSTEAAARLPRVPLISFGDDPRLDPCALVACGVEDHVSYACIECPGSPRLWGALRWAIERRELLEQVEDLRRKCEDRALHDPLTGLANRTLLRDRLDHLIARNRRSGAVFAVLFLDLDGFKAINDELGHQVGDALLQEVARRLRGRLRGGDTCARWGGDEVLILLDEVKGPAAAKRVAADLLSAIGEPIRADGRRLRMRASVGVSLYPLHGDGAEELIRHADEAMYAAKAAGGGAIRVAQEKRGAHA